jgi:hypothetical protein
MVSSLSPDVTHSPDAAKDDTLARGNRIGRVSKGDSAGGGLGSAMVIERL